MLISAGRLDAVAFCCRQCEFGRAVMQRMLEGTSRRPPMRYFGVLRAEQVDIKNELEAMVYNHWDASPAAPSKARPMEPRPDPSLSLLAWNNGTASFPTSYLQKFIEGSEAHQAMLDLQKQLVAEFPSSNITQQTGSRRTTTPAPARAAGRPDFSIDGGIQPLDITRMVDLEHVAASAFQLERTGRSFTQ